MNSCLKTFLGVCRFAGLLTVLFGLTACETLNQGDEANPVSDGPALTGSEVASATNSLPVRSGFEVLRRGDPLRVNFTGVADAPGMHEERIKEDGGITLPLIGWVQAADRTIGEVQKDIHDRYVDKYYKRLNVIVSSEFRFFHIDGEVRKPDRHQYMGEMTVLKAISAAGGFTDFANKKKVQITRGNGQKLTVNCLKALKNKKLDVSIYPDDQIYVPRRIW